MNSQSPVYDPQEVVNFIISTTSTPLRDVCLILHAKVEYLVGLELEPADVLHVEATAESIRSFAPELFRHDHIKQRYLSPALESAYVVKRTELDPVVVDAVLDAELEFSKRVGIVCMLRACPRCGGWIPSDENAGAFAGALSRLDPPVEVCSGCGLDEAVEAWQSS